MCFTAKLNQWLLQLIILDPTRLLNAILKLALSLIIETTFSILLRNNNRTKVINA